MKDLRLKRKLIELGYLKHWSRRGHLTHAEDFRISKGLIKLVLRLTGLHNRGKRNALTPLLRPQRFEFEYLPEAFDGFTILHLSDLHADGLFGMPDCVSDKLRGVEVDLCVLTGDYRYRTRGSCDAVYSGMERIISSVKSRHGTVGILGNHDTADMVPEFERMGIRMLVNESLEIRQEGDSIWFAGLDDPHFYGCDDLPGTLASIPEAAFKVLLVHTPELFEEAAEHGIHLYLCGHTHGGQICLPFVGPLLTHIKCPRRYARGSWSHKGVQGYTSPGVGCSGVPVRFLCPPELVVAELSRKRRPKTQGGTDANAEIDSILASIDTPASQRLPA